MLEYLREVARPYLPPVEERDDWDHVKMERFDASLKVPGEVDVQVYPFIVLLSLGTAVAMHTAALGVGDFGEAMRQQSFARACIQSILQDYEVPEGLF